VKAFLVACAIAILPLTANPQGNQIEIVEEPVYTRHLDGYVGLRGHPEGIPDVRVEECDATWKTVLASATTDEHGHFHLAPGNRGSTYYLRLIALGFNIRMYTVKLSKHAPSKLELELNVGT